MSKAAYNVACKALLPAPEKAVLKELAWFANDAGENTWPSVRYQAERTGFSRRGVQKILRRLEGKGAIEAIGSRLGGRHRTTRYRLVPAWFEANCERKGEREDTERANESAQKSELGSPEQKDHEYEQKSKSLSDKRKEPQALSYEQQRTLQAAKSAIRQKSFPRGLTSQQLQDRRALLRRQASELGKERNEEAKATNGSNND